MCQKEINNINFFPDNEKSEFDLKSQSENDSLYKKPFHTEFNTEEILDNIKNFNIQSNDDSSNNMMNYPQIEEQEKKGIGDSGLFNNQAYCNNELKLKESNENDYGNEENISLKNHKYNSQNLLTNHDSSIKLKSNMIFTNNSWESNLNGSNHKKKMFKVEKKIKEINNFPVKEENKIALINQTIKLNSNLSNLSDKSDSITSNDSFENENLKGRGSKAKTQEKRKQTISFFVKEDRSFQIMFNLISKHVIKNYISSISSCLSLPIYKSTRLLFGNKNRRRRILNMPLRDYLLDEESFLCFTKNHKKPDKPKKTKKRKISNLEEVKNEKEKVNLNRKEINRLSLKIETGKLSQLSKSINELVNEKKVTIETIKVLFSNKKDKSYHENFELHYDKLSKIFSDNFNINSLNSKLLEEKNTKKK